MPLVYIKDAPKAEETFVLEERRQQLSCPSASHLFGAANGKLDKRNRVEYAYTVIMLSRHRYEIFKKDEGKQP